MKSLSINKKIISIVTLIAVSLIVLFEIKFFVQINHIVANNLGKANNPITLYTKLGVVIGFGGLLALLVYVSCFVHFKNEKQRRDFSISVMFFALVNLILVLVFLTTESKEYVKLFQLTATSERNLSYYFFHSKKQFLILCLTLIVILNEISNIRKGKNDKITQSYVYVLSTIVVFVNTMFLMVSALEAKKVLEIFLEDKNKPLFISSIVFSVIAFLVSFAHFIVSLAQRRALGNEALSNKKIRITGTVFNAVEIGFSLLSVALLNSIQTFSTVDFYMLFFFMEYFFLLVLLSQSQIALSAFSIDQRLLEERQQRLLEEEEMKEEFK